MARHLKRHRDFSLEVPMFKTIRDDSAALLTSSVSHFAWIVVLALWELAPASHARDIKENGFQSDSTETIPIRILHI